MRRSRRRRSVWAYIVVSLIFVLVMMLGYSLCYLQMGAKQSPLNGADLAIFFIFLGCVIVAGWINRQLGRGEGRSEIGR